MSLQETSKLLASTPGKKIHYSEPTKQFYYSESGLLMDWSLEKLIWAMFLKAGLVKGLSWFFVTVALGAFFLSWPG